MKIKEIKKIRSKIPAFKGTCGNCNECCQSPIAMNFSELAEIRKKYGDHSRHIDRTICPWYDLEKKRCAVYSERPIVCRMFGIEKGRLTCSHNPDAVVGDEIGLSLGILGGKYFDDLGLPQIMIDHFGKEILKIRGLDKFKVLK